MALIIKNHAKVEMLVHIFVANGGVGSLCACVRALSIAQAGSRCAAILIRYTEVATRRKQIYGQVDASFI
jgi:hypothetical protein